MQKTPYGLKYANFCFENWGTRNYLNFWSRETNFFPIDRARNVLSNEKTNFDFGEKWGFYDDFSFLTSINMTAANRPID